MHPRDICEMSLGHSIGNAVEAAYQRDALVAKRRVLINDWADFCASDRGANVVRLDVGRLRFTPENADLAKGVDDVEGNNVRRSEIPAASR